METPIDHAYKILKKPEDTEFDTLFFPYSIGGGNFVSAEETHKILPVLDGIDYRVSPSGKGTGMVKVWVRKADFDALHKQDKIEADRKSMKAFRKIAPYLAAIFVFIAVVLGALAAWYTYATGVIFGLHTRPLVAFAIVSGTVIFISGFFFIYWLINKGRPG